MQIIKEVRFGATPEKVWDLLINPEMTTQYMFGCAIESDWQIGSPVLWRGKNQEGDDVVFVKGEVLTYEHEKSLAITMFDPNLSMEDIPENYARLTYQITPDGDHTLLEILQDFTGVENAVKRHDESQAGWDNVIQLMKDLIEKE